jgi:polar amino acid transport system substrate-binding protein
MRANLLGLTTVLILAVAGCGGGADESVLRVGLEAAYRPFEMKDAQGELLGFDVEMARWIGTKLGRTVTFHEYNWDGLLPALSAGKIDCVISGMTITEDRKQGADFSKPYFLTWQRLMVGAKHFTITGPEALDREGIVISVQLSTTGDFAAQKIFKNATIRKKEKISEAQQEVLSGQADACVFDEPDLLLFAMDHSDKVKLLPGQLASDQLGIAFRKGSDKLRTAVDAALDDFRASGEYDRLHKKYFVDMTWRAKDGESGN